MNIGHRSRLSLCQLMDAVLNRDECIVLLRKYGISADDIEYDVKYPVLRALRDAISAASPPQVWDLTQELARTRESIRYDISPKRKFDERWEDFTLCMKLDGLALALNDYGHEIGPFVPIEPTIEGAPPIEDDLSRELRLSELSSRDEILQLIEGSAKAFLAGDHNGCLNNARVALETTGRSIARALLPPGSIDRWGDALSGLQAMDFLSVEQEKGLVGVYRFVSPGSHVPVGLTELEFARLGRGLALSCTYFLIKEWNGRRR